MSRSRNLANLPTLPNSKGDIVTSTADNVFSILSVGTNGQFLKANSSATNGIEWSAITFPTPEVTLLGVESLSNKTLIASIHTGKTAIDQVLEGANISTASLTGTVNYNLLTDKAITYFTNPATGNWNINLRGSSSATLDATMAVGQSLTLAYLVTQTTAYVQNTQSSSTGILVDGTGTGVTVKWQGGTVPTSGNANSVDIYSYTVIKTAAATYTVFISRTKFA